MAGVLSMALRVVQFIFTIIILGLVGNMIAEAFDGNPSVVNFAMFTAVLGLLSLLYLTLASFTDKFIIHPMLLVAVDALNAFFFFVAGVALAAELGVESCGNEDYVRNNDITDGSFDPEKRCREAQAATAFIWFNWALFTATTLMSFFASRSPGAGGSVVSSGIRRRGIV